MGCLFVRERNVGLGLCLRGEAILIFNSAVRCLRALREALGAATLGIWGGILSKIAPSCKKYKDLYFNENNGNKRKQNTHFAAKGSANR